MSVGNVDGNGDYCDKKRSNKSVIKNYDHIDYTKKGLNLYQHILKGN